MSTVAEPFTGIGDANESIASLVLGPLTLSPYKLFVARHFGQREAVASYLSDYLRALVKIIVILFLLLT